MEPVKRKANNRLCERFGEPPFTLLDARSRRWMDRKRVWHNRIGDTGQTREGRLWAKAGRIDPVSQTIRSTGTGGGSSLLDPVLAELVFRWFAPAGGLIVDPCAGDTVGGWVAGALGHKFTGIELRADQAAINQQRVDAAGFAACRYVCGDGRRLLDHVPEGSADLVFSCPPYWDLERYSDDPADLSTAPTYEAFLAGLGEILAAAFAALKANRFAAIVIGDVRPRRAGPLVGLPSDMVFIARRHGLRLWNHSVLATPVGTVPLRAARPMLAGRRLATVHQHLLVFLKGREPAMRSELGEIPAPFELS